MSQDEDGPVYMLVIGRIENREKMAAYQNALMESGLYPAHESYYLAFGKPVEMFEGDWPDNQGMVVAKFPSLQQARAFWNSDRYQNEIKPLRDGAGSFNVSVFAAAGDD